MEYKRLKFASLLFIGPLFWGSTYTSASDLGDVDSSDMFGDVDTGSVNEQDTLSKQIQPIIIPAFTTQKGTIKQSIDD